MSFAVRGLGLAGLVVTDCGRGSRVARVFVPRKFQATAVARIGGDLWGYLRGGREQVDYYLAADGTPSAADAELHGRLWARLGLERLDRVAFERLAAGLHPLTGQRLIKTSHVARLDPSSGATVAEGAMHVPGIDWNLSPPKSVSAGPSRRSPARSPTGCFARGRTGWCWSRRRPWWTPPAHGGGAGIPQPA